MMKSLRTGIIEMETKKNPETIGFIKGGQLSLMMLEALALSEKNQKILVLDEESDCPAAPLVDTVIVGDCADYDTVLHFGEKCDVIILEFEHVNTQALQTLQNTGVKIITDIDSLAIIQCKGKQKQFFRDHQIPTADFFTVSGKKALKAKVAEINFPVIQKTFRDGYDGGGVQKISNKTEIARSFDTESVIETCVDIQREFSLIVGRDNQNNTFVYPLVEQFFDPQTHILKHVVSPALVSADVTEQVQKIREKILQHFTGIGLWAIELFLDEKGKILVNEIAPRVHNSGHQTIEGNHTSQFQQCVSIALGHTAGNTDTRCPAIMWNLLGKEDFFGPVCYEGIEAAQAMDRVYVHLYGKSETRPHRKMGHITVLGDTIEACWEKTQALEKLVRVKSRA
jgi:5-(carboxyamino)imidazole ribonucleotide synthase